MKPDCRKYLQAIIVAVDKETNLPVFSSTSSEKVWWKHHLCHPKTDFSQLSEVQSENDSGWLCFRAMSLKRTCCQRRRTWWRARRSWTIRVEKVILIWRGRCDDGGRRHERQWEFFLRKLFKISLRTQQAGFPTTGLSINVPKMENLSSLASPKRAKLRWSSLAFAAPFLIYRHKVSYRCSLPSPLQKRSKDYKGLSRTSPKRSSAGFWLGSVTNAILYNS